MTAHDGTYSECIHEPLGDRPRLTKGKFINLALVQYSLVYLVWGKHTFCEWYLSELSTISLIPDSPFYRKLRAIVSSPCLLKDIKHLSPDCQIYSVELFNTVVIGFATKARAFGAPGMHGR